MSSEKRDLNSSKIYHILPKEKAKKKKKTSLQLINKYQTLKYS